jgi:hypothetical protein
MAKVRFEWSQSGYNELRNSAAVVADITQRAEAVAARAKSMGVKCKVKTHPYPYRAIAGVFTDGIEAKNRNAKNNTLLKSIDAGR